MLQCASVIVAMSMVVGQTEQPDEVKALSWIIGDWVASTKAGDDTPGVQPGEKVTIYVSFSEILSGTKIEWTLRSEAKHKTVFTGKAIIGLDDDQVFKGWWFDSMGRASITEWSRSDQVWTMDTEDDSTWVMERIDQDTWAHKRTRLEGQEVTDPPVITYRRVAGRSETDVSIVGVPKKALREMEYRVGKWESRLITNGVEEPQPGHETTEWCPGKQAIRITSVFVENGVEIQTSGLVGWNAEHQQLIEHWYDSDGGYATFCYSLDKKKDAWVGTFNWVQASGKVLSGESIVEKKSSDLWECNLSCKDNGKRLTWQSFSKRVK